MIRRCPESKFFVTRLVVLVATWLVGSAAVAQPAASADGQTQLELGLRYYDTQQYDKAAEAFRQAYVEEPKSEVLYALAQALRMSGKCDEAKDAFQAFLRTNPDERKAEAARVNMARCEPAPPPAAAPPPPEPVKPPAKAKPAPASRPDARPEASPWYTDATGDALSIAGLAGLTVAGVFFVIESRKTSDMHGASTYAAYESSWSDANRARKVAVVSGTAGGVLLAAGVVRYLTRSPEPGPSELSVAVSPQHGGITWAGRF